MALPTGAEQVTNLNEYLYSHSGAVARLRAGNTSAEEDFQIVAGNLVTDDVSEDSVSTWVAAQAGNDGDAYVVTLYDHTANGNDVTNSTTIDQGLFGEDGSETGRQNYVDMSVSDRYEIGQLITLSAYTVVASLQIDSASSTAFIFGSNTTDSVRWYHGVGNTSGQYFTRNFTQGYTSDGTVTTGSDITWSVRGSSGVGSTVREDGVDQVTAASYTSTATPAVQTLGEAGTQGSNFDGKVYGWAIWNSSLSNGDLDDAEEAFGLASGGSPQTVNIGQISETDSVFAVTSALSQTVSIGLITETDTPLAATVDLSAGDWSWAETLLDTMGADEFKKVSTNRVTDVMLGRTRANFDADTFFANDAAVASFVQNGIIAFSASGINLENGAPHFTGGGHDDSYDGSVFDFNRSTLAWELTSKGPRLTSTASGVEILTANIASITLGDPVVIELSTSHPFVTGDRGDIAGISGTTELNGNTYSLTKIDDTHVSLQAVGAKTRVDVDGSAFTAYVSGGTISVDWASGTPDNHNIRANADGEYVHHSRHSYHGIIHLGGYRFLHGGESIASLDGSFKPDRMWFYDYAANPRVYRGWDEPLPQNDGYLTESGGLGSARGPLAKSPGDGRLYRYDNANTSFSYKLRRWGADFLSIEDLASDGSIAGGEAKGVIYEDPDTAGKYNMFAFKNDAAKTYLHIEDVEASGTPTISNQTLSGSFFNTNMGAVAQRRGYCWDDLNDEIVYWDGGGSIGAFSITSDPADFTTAEVTSSPTGDVPANALTSYSNIEKVPGRDAYILVDQTDVWLYQRSTTAPEVTIGIITETDTPLTVEPVTAQVIDIGIITETNTVPRLGLSGFGAAQASSLAALRRRVGRVTRPRRWVRR